MTEGTNTYMPVAPINNGGFGDMGNNGWWILLLFWAMGMGGNWGWGGGGNRDNFPYMLSNTTNNEVSRGFDNLALSNQLSAIQSTIANGFTNEVAASNAATIQALNSQNALQSQLAQCCCDNRLATCQTQNAINQTAAQTQANCNNNARDIITNATANTQAILDKMCQMELDNVKAQVAARDREISQLQTQLNMANLAASQSQQTAQLIADNTAQTQYIVNRVAPYPVPSYTVSNPYAGTNTCGCGSFA